MKRIAIFFLLYSFSFVITAQQIWTKTDEAALLANKNRSREIIPDAYRVVSLDWKSLTSTLRQAPEFLYPEGSRNNSSVLLPMPDGTMEEFVIWQAPVMEKELALKYPAIQSYKGYQKNKKQVTARFSIGPNGFHGAVKSEEGMMYIDPYAVNDTENYIVYYTANHTDDSLKQKVLCGTDESTYTHTKDARKWGQRMPGSQIELRKYRLALGCTSEWGQVRGTKEKALADMVVFVERANVVFEAELAVTAILIAKNDELIFLDGSTDPYTNPNQGLSILGQNTGILNGRVGFASYEIGHVFSICFDVGGVAGGNICTPGKGAGVTCHNSAAISSGIVLVFNHEVGHQMTASHTFNRCGDSDQLALGTAYEPGGGSTIMAYPGACGSDNLGASRDDYYHVASLEQMLSFTNSEGSDAYDCAEKIEINNDIPVLTLPYKDGFSIPRETPFFLKGSATDANGDILTYNWDQFDNQTSSPLGAPVGNAPLFRSLKPTTNPARYFPNVSRILNGQFNDKSELLPTYGRDLTFRFVVRDNNPLGNAAAWQEMKFKVAANAGPFKLTYPVLDYKLKVGKELKVTWDVANTDLPPVSCKTVDIYIAFNNSLDFSSDNLLLVAKAVDNDGEEVIIVPNKTSIRARVVVKASDNIFLTTGLFNSRIDQPDAPSFFMDVAESVKAVCLPDFVQYDFTTAGFAGITDNINFEVVSGLPQGAVATFTNPAPAPGGVTSLQLDLADVKGTKVYKVVVRAWVEGVDTIERTVILDATSTDLDFVSLFEPLNGISGVGPTQKYRWEYREDAVSYELQVATSPAFKPEQIVFVKTTTESSFSSNNFLEKATIYYWRVRSVNACKAGLWSEIYAFNTEALNCSIIKSGELSVNISQSGTPKVETILNVFNDGSISDVNVKNIKADHQWSGDLVAFLTAPSGKEVLLWSRRCGSSKGLNLGMDDQSNEFFQCPINTGRIYRPESPLSVFNGENMKGNWILRLEDRAAGNGGRLQNFDLELCANIVLSPPLLTRNEVLKIQPKDSRDIDRLLLLSEDTNNGPGELTYILVAAPSKGILTVNGNPAAAGSVFTQDDIDKNKIKYWHTADDEADDTFSFVVSDGQGGWISITEFMVDVDDASPSATSALDTPVRILVYPNPASGTLHLQVPDNGQGAFEGFISDMTGRVLKSFYGNGKELSLDIQDLTQGVYLINIRVENGAANRKFVKY